MSKNIYLTVIANSDNEADAIQEAKSLAQKGNYVAVDVQECGSHRFLTKGTIELIRWGNLVFLLYYTPFNVYNGV
jgi:hypothetical protein